MHVVNMRKMTIETYRTETRDDILILDSLTDPLPWPEFRTILYDLGRS